MPKFEFPDPLWEIEIETRHGKPTHPEYGYLLDEWDVRLNFCDRTLEYLNFTEDQDVPGTDGWRQFQDEGDVLDYVKQYFFEKMAKMWSDL